MVGDFNMTPEELQTTSFLGKVKASIVVASEGQASCRSGRLLDYIVASNVLVPALAQVKFTPAPWKTHDMITFKILRAPREIQARFLVRPTRFATNETSSWQDAQAHFTQPQEPHQLGSPDLPLETVLESAATACEANAQAYASWSQQAEAFLADKC